MTDRVKLKMAVSPDEAGLPVGELGKFFALFDRAYREVGKSLDLRNVPERLDAGQAPSRKDLLQYLQSMKGRKFGSAKVPPATFVSFSYNSPFKGKVVGNAVLLSFAVVLSGGSIKVGPDGVSATLPPIAEGIVKLEEAIKHIIKDLEDGLTAKEAKPPTKTPAKTTAQKTAVKTPKERG